MVEILQKIVAFSKYMNFNIQENFQPFCFFTYSNEIFSILPAVIRAYPKIPVYAFIRASPCIRDLKVHGCGYREHGVSMCHYMDFVKVIIAFL